MSVALRRVWIDVRLAARAKLARECVVRWARFADIIRVAAAHLDRTAKGFGDRVAADAVKARKVHAAKHIVGRVILHV